MTTRTLAHAWSFALIVTIASAAPLPEGACEIKNLTAPAVSADGRTIVFEWIDDLWTAPSGGGEALRVVRNPARDSSPRFTPDGKRIVFSSDRTGTPQVFSIPAGGGETVQHTRHGEGSELEFLSPDGSHALVRGVREISGARATVLMAINLTRDEREQRWFGTSVGHGAAWSPDGTRVLFCKGGEPQPRKGYRGSRASQIWQFDLGSEKFERLSAADTESRTPAWHPDGLGFTFLSAEKGPLRLWTKRFAEAAATPLTALHSDPMAMSADGSTFIVSQDLRWFRLQPAINPIPQPIRLWTRVKPPDTSRFKTRITTTVDADFSGATTVFAAADELWCIRRPGGKTGRLTNTRAAESNVRFSPDGEWLYFLRDDGLESEILRARFHEGTLAEPTTLVRGPRSKYRLMPSPDGQRIAWVEGTGDVFTANADGTDACRVFPCWDSPTFDWAPDGKHLAIAAEDRNANRDLWLVAADGGREPVNLTRHPGFDGSPRWSPDGRKLAFSAKRANDGKTGLWLIDFGTADLVATVSTAGLQALGEKARPIATGGREPVRVVWSADSKELWFQSQAASDPSVYAITPGSNTLRTVANQRGVPIRMTRDGTLLWRVNQTPARLKSGLVTLHPVSASLERHRPEVQELAFRRIWRTVGERFHDPTMNGTDWPAVRRNHEPAAREARTSRQFERVIRQMLGELNSSHLSFSAIPWAGEKVAVPTSLTEASPGWTFRDGGPESPLVIAKVIPGTPAAALEPPPQPGDVIATIDGHAVTSRTPLDRFFHRAAGKTLPMTLRTSDGPERSIEVRCISYPQLRSLVATEREVVAREAVARGGKFAYLKVRDMSDESFHSLELAVYRASLEVEGLVLDLRDNGGGREADRMLSLFCQPEHSFTVPRDGPPGYPNARLGASKWQGPLVVLCNENTFSNAEIFCHAVKSSGRAPLIGTATAGAVASSTHVNIPDAGELQIPFRAWFQTESGENFDRQAARPDHSVAFTPADEHAGRDPQLETAVAVLRGLVKSAPPPR